MSLLGGVGDSLLPDVGNWWHKLMVKVGLAQETKEDYQTNSGAGRALDTPSDIIFNPTEYFGNLTKSLVYPKEKDAVVLLSHQTLVKELIANQHFSQKGLIWNTPFDDYRNYIRQYGDEMFVLGCFDTGRTARATSEFGGSWQAFARQQLLTLENGERRFTLGLPNHLELGRLAGAADQSANASIDDTICVSVNMTGPFIQINGFQFEIHAGASPLLDILRNLDWYNFGADGAYPFNYGHIGGDMLTGLMRALGFGWFPKVFVGGEILGCSKADWRAPPTMPFGRDGGWRHWVCYPGGYQRVLMFTGYRYRLGVGYPHHGDSDLNLMVKCFAPNRAVWGEDPSQRPYTSAVWLWGPQGMVVVAFCDLYTDRVPNFTSVV